MPMPRPTTDVERELRRVQCTHARACRSHGYDDQRCVDLRRRVAALAALNALDKTLTNTEFTHAERTQLIETAARAKVRDESIGSVAA